MLFILHWFMYMLIHSPQHTSKCFSSKCFSQGLLSLFLTLFIWHILGLPIFPCSHWGVHVLQFLRGHCKVMRVYLPTLNKQLSFRCPVWSRHLRSWLSHPLYHIFYKRWHYLNCNLLPSCLNVYFPINFYHLILFLSHYVFTYEINFSIQLFLLLCPIT